MSKPVKSDLLMAEELAMKRVMRHRGLDRKAAKAYMTDRLGKGRAAGGMKLQEGKLTAYTAKFTKPTPKPKPNPKPRNPNPDRKPPPPPHGGHQPVAPRNGPPIRKPVQGPAAR